MEDEEEDHFEDFTTASDWEVFIARLELILRESSVLLHHQNNQNNQNNNNWIQFHDKIQLYGRPYKFSYFKKVVVGDGGNNWSRNKSAVDPLEESIIGVSNLSSSSSTGHHRPSGTAGDPQQLPPYLDLEKSKEIGFPPTFSPHLVAEFFSLDEFSVLSSSSLEPLQSESTLKLITSSACIALNNTNSSFPIFIQYHHWNQNYFYGIAESLGVRTSFTMVHLRHLNPHYYYLAGLLEIFKSKIGPNVQHPICVNVHVFYRMNTWHPDYVFDTTSSDIFQIFTNQQQQLQDQEEEEQVQSENENENEKNVKKSSTNILPFGSKDDAFGSLELVVGWTNLTENVVVDTSSYSDLVPENAPSWFFGLKPRKNAEFWLNEILTGFCELSKDSRSVEEVLGKKLDGSEVSVGGVEILSALDKITEPAALQPIAHLSLGRVIKRAQRQILFSPSNYQDLPPIDGDQLDIILPFLFPDSQPNSKLHSYPTNGFTLDTILKPFKKESTTSLAESLQGIKSAPVGSLLYRLALLSAHLNTCFGAVPSVCHLWAEFVLELRYRWEKSIRIPGLEVGVPNSGTCLLNQKLQMLNCCIEKKISREKDSQEREKAALGGEIFEETDDEDEFFDAEELDYNNDQNNLSCKPTSSTRPLGRLRKCGRLRLIGNDEPMYIPLTQEPAPLTEDLLDEQARILVELGDDAGGSELRAKMMSASLLSDMEAFKAANPGSVLEDFVRWYSPRDWIEFEGQDGQGELSPRMKMPGNLWLEVWNSARCIPARRQNRLFDDTKEAEKVLRWMSSRSLSDLWELLFPCLLHGALLKVLEEIDSLPMDQNLGFQIPPQQLIPNSIQLTRSLQPSTEINSSKSPKKPKSNSSDFFLDSTELDHLRQSILNSLLKCEREITQIKSFLHKFPSMGDQLGKILQEKEVEKKFGDFLPNYIEVEGGGESEIGKSIGKMFKKEFWSVNQSVCEEEDEKLLQHVFPAPFKRVFVLQNRPNNILNKPPSELELGMEWLPQRMSCLLKNDEFLLAGTFSCRTDLT